MLKSISKNLLILLLIVASIGGKFCLAEDRKNNEDSRKKNNSDSQIHFSKIDRGIAFMDAGEMQVNGMENYGLIGRRGFPYCRHGFWGDVRWIVPMLAVPPQAWATNIKTEAGTIVNRSQYYNVIESVTSYFCQPEQDSNYPDWEAQDNSRMQLMGDATWSERPLIATSTIPNSWPQGYFDKDPASPTFLQFIETPDERHWPGYWALDPDPNSPTFGKPMEGIFNSDKDIYFIMNDKYNGIRTGDNVNTGYPIGFDIEVSGYCYSTDMYKDMVFLNYYIIYREDITDPDRQFHAGTIDSLYFAFWMDADLPGRDPQGNTMDPFGEDDYCIADTVRDIFILYDKDGHDRDDDAPHSEGPVSVYSFALLNTPENVGLTGYHFFEEYGFVALSRGDQVERVLYAMASGKKSILSQQDQEKYFHGIDPYFDSYDSLRILQERSPVGHRSSYFFLFTSGPFSISPGDTMPYHLCIIGGEDNPGPLDADGFGTNPPEVRFADTYKKLEIAKTLYNYNYGKHTVRLKSLNNGGIFSGLIDILWETVSTTGNPLQNVDLFFSRNSGNTWIPLSLAESNNGLYNWNTEQVADGIHYRIKIFTTDGMLIGQAISELDFTINNPGNAAPELDLINPVNDFIASGEVPVEWFAGDADGDTLSITLQYSWDDGFTWTNIATNEENDGKFTWQTWQAANTAMGKLRIIASDIQLSDTATAPGTITISNLRHSSPDQTFQHVSGYGNMPISVHLVDINDVTNHTYELTFDDTSAGDETLYSIQDLNAGEQVLSNAIISNDIEGPYFDGVRLQFDRYDEIEFYRAGWKMGGTATNWTISDLQPLHKRAGYYEFRYFGGEADTVLINQKTIPFQIWNLVGQEPKQVDFFISKPNNPVLENGDIIFLVEDYPSLEISWQFKVTWPADNEIPPDPGDVYFQESTIPFSSLDTLTFTIATTSVDNDNEIGIAKDFVLSQNYPNPFNQTTRIQFYLPQPASVQITIYNVLGESVKTLTDRKYFHGKHSVSWDGKNENGIVAASGLYFYRIRAGKFVQTNKMILIR